MRESDILIIGKTGQIASYLVSEFPAATAFDRKDLDLSQIDKIKDKLEQSSPKLVINAAAYTAVDRAESEADLASLVNTAAVKVVSEYCAKRSVILVHFSTDYVYEGQGHEALIEDEKPNPLNVYGRSKLFGDRAVMESSCRYLIFRISAIYNYLGKNFLKSVFEKARLGQSLKIVDDQYVSPSYAKDIARMSAQAIRFFLEKDCDSGIFHLANSGYTTWHDFAVEAFQQALQLGLLQEAPEIKRIKTSELNLPAKRPLNTRLSTEKFQKCFGVIPRPWNEALADCLKEIKV